MQDEVGTGSIWQEAVNKKAERVCQDPADRELLVLKSFDLYQKVYASARMEEAGEFGEWVEAEQFKKLVDQFLLAMELIQVMEEREALNDLYRELTKGK